MRQRVHTLLLACLLVPAGSVEGHGTGGAVAQKLPSGIVIMRQIYQPPGPTGWPVHAFVHRAVRAVFTLRYSDARHWTLQGRYLSPPRDPFLLRNGTLATPFSPFPGSIAQQGDIITHYDAHHRVVTRVAVSSDGMNPLSGNAGLYLDHLCGPAIRSPTLCSHAFANLGSLLRWERRCRTAALQGARNIAGRKAYIVSLGPDQCNRASAAGYLLLGREIAWLDTSTLVLLRLDRFFPGTQRLLVRTVTTHVIFK